MMNNKEYLMGPNMSAGGSTSSNSSSVPLYKRHGLAMGNGHNLNSAGNSSGSTGGHSLSSSTPDNILTGSPNDILAGLTTGGSTLIEALLQQDQQQQQQQNNTTLQKLLYNNFNATGIKNDMDLFMGNNTFVTGLSDGVANTFHTQNFQQHQANNIQHPVNNAGPTAGDNRNTTYAAVLSQGPQQQDAALQQHHNFQHNSMVANLSGNGLGLGLTVGGSANNGDSSEKDPFAAIRELGQGTNGFYNYFQ